MAFYHHTNFYQYIVSTEDIPQVEVSEPPQGVLPPNPAFKKPVQQASKVSHLIDSTQDHVYLYH